jgi:hypothetical protein
MGSPDPYDRPLCAGLPVRPAGGRSVVLRFWVRLRRRWLDVLLARGTNPEASTALALRAHQLTSSRMRDRLSSSIDGILRSIDHPRHWHLTSGPECVCIAAARADLQAIGDMLRGGSLVYARGVAMTSTLVGNAESPLFDRREAASAWYSALLAVRALEGHL